MQTFHHRLLILGSGPAGYTASIYGSRANLKPAIITGIQMGGQLMTTTEIENWPGGAPHLTGPQLMFQLEEHAKRLDVTLYIDHIHTAYLQEKPIRLIGDQGEYTADALIIATGASARYLGLDSEKKFLGKGVSACATCDGFFYRGKTVAVVGGGDTAMEEALYLSNIAQHVILIHRRNQFRSEKILRDRVFAKAEAGKISFQMEHTLKEILGDERGVHSLLIENVQSHATQTLSVDGVFIAIGHSPNTDLFKGQLEMENGYLKVSGGFRANATATHIPGVFAAGDVADPHYAQAITAAASGCMALMDAENYLDQL